MTLDNTLFEKCLSGDSASIDEWNQKYAKELKRIDDNGKILVNLDPKIIEILETGGPAGSGSSARTRKTRLTISGLVLEKSNLSKIDIKNINFENCNLDNACFKDAFISECSFINDTKLNSANFEYASLRNVEFSFPNPSHKICNISFKWADLLKTNFKNIDFKNGNSNENPCPNFSFSTFNQVTFVNCNFTNINFLSSKLRGIFFEQYPENEMKKTATLSNVDFTGSEILPSNFNNLQIDKCKFDKCNLKSVDFGKSIISGSSFEDTDFGNSSFANATIECTSFKRSHLNYVNFKKSSVKKCKFYRANLYQTHPRIRYLLKMSSGQRYKDSMITSKFDITFLSFVMVMVGFLSVLMSCAEKLTRFLCIVLLSLFLVIMLVHYIYKKFRLPDLVLYICVVVIIAIIAGIVIVCCKNYDTFSGLFVPFDFKLPFDIQLPFSSGSANATSSNLALQRFEWKMILQESILIP